MKNIILDTTELFKSPLLDSPSFEELKVYLRATKTELVIPSVVVYEACYHAEKSCREGFKQTRKVLGKIGKYSPHSYNLSGLQKYSNETSENYRTLLDERILDLTGEVFDCSTANLDRIAKRAIRNIPPFKNDSDKGFKDNLVWECALSKLENNGEVILVTNNSNDFSEDLYEELDELGIERYKLKIFDSVDSLSSNMTEPKLTQLKFLSSISEISTVPPKLQKFINLNLALDMEIARGELISGLKGTLYHQSGCFELEILDEMVIDFSSAKFKLISAKKLLDKSYLSIEIITPHDMESTYQLEHWSEEPKTSTISCETTFVVHILSDDKYSKVESYNIADASIEATSLPPALEKMP